MIIGRILYPIHELGPGNRIGIWVQGCSRACPGCANPELWAFDEKKDIPVDLLISMITTAILSSDIKGLTVTGGEPMLQAAELRQVLKAVKPICDDILLFSGFKYEELMAKNDPNVNEVLSLISVLVDGEYLIEQNTGDRLRGSRNQKIIFLDENKKDSYIRYMASDERYIDSFLTDDGVISVGIHPQQFLDEMGFSLDTMSNRNQPKANNRWERK